MVKMVTKKEFEGETHPKVDEFLTDLCNKIIIHPSLSRHRYKEEYTVRFTLPLYDQSFHAAINRVTKNVTLEHWHILPSEGKDSHIRVILVVTPND